jgi:hypothetical protein
MVCVWPLSPSSYVVVTIAIAITNGVVKETSTIVTQSSDYVWVDTYCASSFVETSANYETCPSTCAIVY